MFKEPRRFRAAVRRARNHRTGPARPSDETSGLRRVGLFWLLPGQRRQSSECFRLHPCELEQTRGARTGQLAS